MNLLLGEWEWEREIEGHRKKQRAIPSEPEAYVFIKTDKVYLKANYFEELAKQMRHKVGVVTSTFPKQEGYYLISPQSYLRLQKYMPLPPWDKLKIRE